MARDYSIEIPAHNSIYDKHYKEDNYANRKLRVDYSEPRLIDEDTGILLLISGYGGNIDSRVYKKMRRTFCDKYNLVVLQCDYFGNEFMQTMTIEEVKKMYNEWNELHTNIKTKDDNVVINLEYHMNESRICMNDMGIMQSIDNINAVLTIMKMLNDKEIIFNTKKILIYGHSHGAYLAYLCNRFCPGLFQMIIDNSAYVYPKYMNQNRSVRYLGEGLTVNVNYNYIAKEYTRDLISHDLYSLRCLYDNFENLCYIVCYHGSGDTLIPINEKRRVTDKINRMIFMEISEEDLDGDLFKNCSHGLDGDFLKLFDITYQSMKNKFQHRKHIEVPCSVEINMKNGKVFYINYKDMHPIISLYSSTDIVNR